MNGPLKLKTTVETFDIEGGRKLYRYTFAEVEEPPADREDKGEIVDPSALVAPEARDVEG